MNKRQSISCALITLSALLFGPANALALSDLDTKFRVKADGQGRERHLQCELLTITNGTLICRNGNFDDRIPLSHVKQLDVEYMGKLYIVSDINTSDINSANIMSANKEEAFSRQEKANRASKEEQIDYDPIARRYIQRGEGLLDTWQPSVNPSVELSSESRKKGDADQKRYDQAIAEAAANFSSWQPPDNKEAKGETTEDISIFVFIISLFFTWIIALAPPLLIRFTFIKRPLGKWKAIGTVATLWFINIFIAIAIGSKSKTHGGLVLIAFASYAILRRSNKNKQSSESSCNEQIKEKSNKPSPESPCNEHTKEPSIPYAIKKSLYLFDLNENSSFEDVKIAYRKRMAEYHPDKVSHLGADLRKFAEDKTKKYNIAFGIIKEYFSSAGRSECNG